MTALIAFKIGFYATLGAVACLVLVGLAVGCVLYLRDGRRDSVHDDR